MARYTPWRDLTEEQKSARQAQRRARTNEAAERLERSVQDMIAGEAFQAVLRFSRTLHRYSMHNIMMIWSQRPDATHVAGFNAWRSLDRHVVKGAKAIKIWVPIKRRSKETPEDQMPDVSAGGAGAATVAAPAARPGVRFILGSVFDVKDTDGAPLPEFPKMVFDGTDRPEYHVARDRLLAYAREKLACEVLQEMRPGSARGSWNPEKRQLWVASDGPIVEQLSVGVHETTHALAGHSARVSRREYAVQEVVADGAAFLVMDAFGFDTSLAATPYLASYAKTPDVLLAGMTEARVIAEQIIQDLEDLWLPLFPEVAAARAAAQPAQDALAADGADRSAGEPDDSSVPIFEATRVAAAPDAQSSAETLETTARPAAPIVTAGAVA
ncbi:MAG: hypothetical protein H3C62_01310 [Gemmatimonadaceae bacterium]|nr:hypothetical protein [Gemmatimonadaceae bacterium]